MWGRYKPIGMKIKFMPAATLDSSIAAINVGTSMETQLVAPNYLDELPITTDVLSRTLDCKTYNPRSGF